MNAVLSISRFVASAAVLALIGCNSPSAERPAGSLNYGSNPAAGETVVLGGNRFYYETYGHGTPILLIHGNGGSIVSFKEQIADFSRSHEVVAMDSRGQGRSELGSTPLTYDEMAEDIDALLDRLELSHVKVLGWSDGGIVGMLLAIRHPDKVSMLAMMGANLEPDAAYAWARDGVARARSRLTSALARGDDPKPLNRDLQLLGLLDKQPHIPVADLGKIQVPVLVMAADRDVISDEHVLRMFHALPKAQLAIFPGATHLIPQQDPVRFNRTVLDFFDKPFAMPDTRDLGWFD